MTYAGHHGDPELPQIQSSLDTKHQASDMRHQALGMSWSWVEYSGVETRRAVTASRAAAAAQSPFKAAAALMCNLGLQVGCATGRLFCGEALRASAGTRAQCSGFLG